MKGHFGMPGPGGSLGQCALCGENFLMEILTGQTVKSFDVDGCNQTLYAHKGCAEKFHGKPISADDLPPKSPLRVAFSKPESA